MFTFTRHRGADVISVRFTPLATGSARVTLAQVDMDVVKAVETYITKMVSVPSAMKVLLLDSHTVRHNTLRPS